MFEKKRMTRIIADTYKAFTTFQALFQAPYICSFNPHYHPLKLELDGAPILPPSYR